MVLVPGTLNVVVPLATLQAFALAGLTTPAPPEETTEKFAVFLLERTPSGAQVMVGAGTFCPTVYVAGLNTQLMVRGAAAELLEPPLVELLEPPVELLEPVPELLEPLELLEPPELLLAVVTATVPQGTFRCVTEPQVAVTLIV